MGDNNNKMSYVNVKPMHKRIVSVADQCNY